MHHMSADAFMPVCQPRSILDSLHGMIGTDLVLVCVCLAGRQLLLLLFDLEARQSCCWRPVHAWRWHVLIRRCRRSYSG